MRGNGERRENTRGAKGAEQTNHVPPNLSRQRGYHRARERIGIAALSTAVDQPLRNSVVSSFNGLMTSRQRGRVQRPRTLAWKTHPLAMLMPVAFGDSRAFQQS